jgi:hypothetical protein
MGRPDRLLNPTAGPLPRFASDLRQLRGQAGDLTYRQLARRAHYSSTTLSDAAGGSRLPSLPVTLAYVAACGGDVESWRRRWMELADDHARACRPDRQPADGVAPEPARPGPQAAVPSTGDLPAEQSTPSRRPARWRTPAAGRALSLAAAVALLVGAGVVVAGIGHRPGRAGGQRPAGPAAAPAGQRIRYDFEDTVAPWGPFWNAPNLRATLTTAVAYSGHRSLRLAAAPNSGRPPAIGTTAITGLSPGGNVTMRIYYDGQGTGAVHAYAQDTGYGIDWSPTPGLTLHSRGWTSYTWRVPNIAVKGIGLQIDNAGSSDTVLALDTISW